MLLKTNPMPYQGEEGIKGCFMLTMLLEHTYTVDQNRFADLTSILIKGNINFTVSGQS